MPFNGNASFNSAGYGMQAAQAISDAIEKHRKLQVEGSYNDTIMQHALRLGATDPETYNKYLQSSWTQKQGIANGVAASMMDDFKRQQAQAQQQTSMMNASANYANVQSEIDHRKYVKDFRPNMFNVTEPNNADGTPGKSHVVIQQQPGGPWQGLGALDESAQQNTPLQLTPDEIATYAKAGKIPLRTSNKSFQAADAPEPDVVSDPSKWRSVTIPGTQLQVVVDEKGNRVPNGQLQGVLHPNATAQQLQVALHGSAATAPTPAPSPAPVGTVQPAANSAPSDPYLVGRKYKDPDGNTAVYMGNGQWKE